jgi:hypothetical protein
MLAGFVATLVGIGLDVSETTGVTLFTVSFDWAKFLWIIVGFVTFIVIPFIGFHRIRVQRDELQSRLDKIPPPAVLNIRGPFQHQAEVDINILPLWQVVVENTQAESIAKNVRVSIDNPNPKIIMSFPMNLHLMHDNNKPFQKCHDIRYGDPLTYDLFACGQVDPEMYYIYRSDGDESEQIGPEWTLSSDDNDIISPAVHHPGGWRFDVRAVPDPPASPAHQTFCLKWDDNKRWPYLEAIKQ